MKAVAVVTLLVAHITNTSSFRGEIPISAVHGIIKSVISAYRSTPVNILYYPTTEGMSDLGPHR
jgi:hypothetical protein